MQKYLHGAIITHLTVLHSTEQLNGLLTLAPDIIRISSGIQPRNGRVH